MTEEKTSRPLATKKKVSSPRLAADLFLAALAELDVELLQLAVEVGALQPGALGQLGHVAAFQPQVMLEIEFLESIARFAQRLVKHRQQRVELPVAALFLRQHARHVVGGDFLV